MSIKTIFLVDDDVDDQEIFISALEEVDSSIICFVANDGEEALEKLSSQIFIPDLIFLDMNMPRMDGIQFLRKIKQEDELKDIPVIMYSTTANTEHIEESVKLGAIDFVTKPVHFSENRKLIESVIKRFL